MSNQNSFPQEPSTMVEVTLKLKITIPQREVLKDGPNPEVLMEDQTEMGQLIECLHYNGYEPEIVSVVKVVDND